VTLTITMCAYDGQLTMKVDETSAWRILEPVGVVLEEFYVLWYNFFNDNSGQQ
jgi:hypothetical protein